jgi:hypothetical protein
MKPILINNSVKIDNKYIIPIYIYNKLYSECKDKNKNKYISLLLNKYLSTISSFSKPKLLFFIISIFNIKIELYSNPFINMLPFCSNFDIDLYFNGVNKIEQLNPIEYESMLLIDPRPPINYLKNINHIEADKNLNNIINKSINIINNNINETLSLIILSHYIIKNKLDNIHFTQFDIIISDNYLLYIYFIQTKKGYNKYKPTLNKINLLKTFIDIKKRNYKKYKSKTNFLILSDKK